MRAYMLVAGAAALAVAGCQGGVQQTEVERQTNIAEQRDDGSRLQLISHEFIRRASAALGSEGGPSEMTLHGADGTVSMRRDESGQLRLEVDNRPAQAERQALLLELQYLRRLREDELAAARDQARADVESERGQAAMLRDLLAATTHQLRLATETLGDSRRQLENTTIELAAARSANVELAARHQLAEEALADKLAEIRELHAQVTYWEERYRDRTTFDLILTSPATPARRLPLPTLGRDARTGSLADEARARAMLSNGQNIAQRYPAEPARAARYYHQVISQFPDTNSAREAQLLLDELSTL